MREWLEWQRKDFVEYDVDKDRSARGRLRELSGGQRSVPVLVEDNKIIRIGWEGRTCVIEAD
jgi:glutaredoxin 3